MADVASVMGMASNEGTEKIADEANGMRVPAQPRKEERDNSIVAKVEADSKSMYSMLKSKETKSGAPDGQNEEHHYYLRSQKATVNDVQNKFNDIQIDEKSRRRAKGSLQ